MLWQKIDDANNYAALVHLLTTETPPEHRVPGSYMVEALKYRDQWESRSAADVGLVTPVLSAVLPPGSGFGRRRRPCRARCRRRGERRE